MIPKYFQLSVSGGHPNPSAKMGSEKPHAVCIPYPAQGHINPMLKLAKLLHCRGFRITFVNTEFNHTRLLNAQGPNCLSGLPTFQFETIPDGLPPSDVDATQDIPSLCVSTKKNCLAPFRRLLAKLNHDGPPVTCIFSDAIMSFTLDAAQELGIPDLLLWTASACGFMAYVQYRSLIDKGFTPLKGIIPSSALNTSFSNPSLLPTLIFHFSFFCDMQMRVI